MSSVNQYGQLLAGVVAVAGRDGRKSYGHIHTHVPLSELEDLPLDKIRLASLSARADIDRFREIERSEESTAMRSACQRGMNEDRRLIEVADALLKAKLAEPSKEPPSRCCIVS